ncbi:hypothetical protein ABZ772_14555 [Streptomyces griseoincarnatus]
MAEGGGHAVEGLGDLLGLVVAVASCSATSVGSRSHWARYW